jgi:branched-chain amino acid transport system substrate-binding protein
MNRERSRWMLLVSVVATSLLLLAACGSSSKKTSSAAHAQTGAAAPASTPKGAPIRLGAICSCTGAQASSLGLINKVSIAWADSVNAAGGINGHPVQMTVLDDGGNPATSLQDAKQLVEQDHVIAIVGETSLADAAWASYVTSKNVPVIGGTSIEATFLTNPNFYPSGTQLVVLATGTIALAKTAQKSHLGVMYCSESPICAQVVPLAQGAAALSGLKVTTAKISSTAPSYVPQCLPFKSGGVDALFVADGSPVVQHVTRDCVQQGYKLQTVNETPTASNAWLTDSSLDGALLAGYNANAFDTSTPAIQEFQAALNKYAPGYTTSPQFNFIAVGPWAGGKLFEAAAQAANVGPNSTGADVKKGLYMLKNETLGGLAPPLTFTPGKPAFVPCYFSVQLKGGKFVSLNGNQPTCLTPTQTTALLKALHLG